MDSQIPSLCGPPPGSPSSRERPRQPPAGTEVRYLPRLHLESSMGQIPGSAFISYSLPFGQQGRFLSWAGRTQTAQIPKAPYFSTKYILQTLQPPWNIPDLTFSPPSFPSGTLGSIVMGSPQAQPSLGGRPGLLRMRLPGSHLRGWLSTQGGPGWEGQPLEASTMLWGERAW